MYLKESTKERISGGVVAFGAISVALLLVNTNTKIVWLPFVFFSILFVVSQIRVVFVSIDAGTISMNSDTSIVGGSIVIFSLLNSPLSFVLALLATVIYPPNIRERKWALLIFNVSNEVIAGCAAYMTLNFLSFSLEQNLIVTLAKVFVATAVFELVNYLILAIDSAFRGEKWKEMLYDLRKSLVEVMPLAVFSGMLGKFYFDYGALMLLLFVLPLFLGRELSASYANMAETQKSTLDTLTRTLEAKDKYTAGHVERVAMFAKYIGEELGYGPRHLERIRQAALLHDAGKLIVPSALLNKPGRLTDEEFKIIQRHEFVTIEILSMIDFLAPIAELAGGDHNKMEGKSLRNLDPFIVSACDAFDAMTSSRSYRKALSMEVAFEELHSKQGKQFHPKVVEALIKAIESRGEHYGDGYEVDAVHADAPEAGLGSAGIGDLETSKNDSGESEILGSAQDDNRAQDNSVAQDDSTNTNESTEQHTIPSVKRSAVEHAHSDSVSSTHSSDMTSGIEAPQSGD